MKKTLSIVVIALLMLSMTFVGPLTHAAEATIWTDKEDYEYYETVTIFGTGFQALVDINVTIVKPDETSDIVYAVSDDVGNFTCTYQLNGIIGTYTVTATDGTNTATTTFTESAITPELWGYTLEPSPKWTKGDVKGYYECEWVPYKIEIESTKKDSYQLTVVVHHDYYDGTWYGLDDDRNFQMWRNGVPETPSISGPLVNGWESRIQQLQFNWTFTINENDNCTLMFETHLAIGAHNYPGSKVHTHIHSITSVPHTSIAPGHRDVPIVVKGPPREADVAIQKTGVNYAHEGETIAYQFRVTNNGPGTAYNVQVIDNLLGNLTAYLPDTTLDVGEVNTFSVNYVVPIPSEDITNTVTVTSATSDPDPTNNQASWTVNVLHPGIDVSKIGPLYAHEGDTITYTITVCNTGENPLYSVFVTDTLLGPIYSDGLAVGECKTFTLTYVVPIPSGDITNTVIASGYDILGLQVSDSATWTVTVLHPSLDVTKTGPNYAHEGESITYTITVINSGDCPLYGVSVTDTILGDLTGYLPDTTLDIGEVNQFTVNYVVPIPSGDITNTVTASGSDILGLQVSDSDSWTVDVLHPDIDVSKSGPLYAHEGDTITYTITVSNPSTDTTMFKVSVIDSLLGDISASFSDSLPPLTSETKTFTYIVPSPSDDITNTVTATYKNGLEKPITDSDSWTVDVLHPKIDVSKIGPLYAHEGDMITYTIIVRNIGDTSLYNVLVTDTLLGVIYSNDLAVGETKTFTINYVVPTPSGDITNTATASGFDILGLQVSDMDSWTVDVLHPGIDVTKTGPSRAREGETIIYTITVCNTGDCPLYSVFVTDTLLGPIYSDGLAVGECKTFNLPYTVPICSGDITNTVTASGSDILGLQVSDSATWFVKIQYYLTIKTDPSGLTPTPLGEGWYDGCTILKLRASDIGYLGTMKYLFIYWDVDGTSQGIGVNPITVHMNKNHTATAHYKPLVPHHLDAEPPVLIDLTNPVCTEWAELYPEFGRGYHIESWYDTDNNGILDPSDYIDLWDIDRQEKAHPYYWHIDDVTVTLKVTKKNSTETMYIEFEGGWSKYYCVIEQPVCTQWLEVYPNYGNEYHLLKKVDGQEPWEPGWCDLSPCDQIELENKLTGEKAWYHVDEVKTDLIVSPKATEIILCKTKEHIGEGYPQILPIIIRNYYSETTTFDIAAYYDGLQPIGNQSLTLNPLDSGDAILVWNEVATWPKGTYTVTITIVVHFPDCTTIEFVFPITFQISILGDLNGDGKVDMKDIAPVAKAFGTKLCQPRWNPDADLNYDINNDLLVDMKDIAIVSKNFGKVDP